MPTTVSAPTAKSTEVVLAPNPTKKKSHLLRTPASVTAVKEGIKFLIITDSLVELNEKDDFMIYDLMKFHNLPLGGFFDETNIVIIPLDKGRKYLDLNLPDVRELVHVVALHKYKDDAWVEYIEPDFSFTIKHFKKYLKDQVLGEFIAHERYHIPKPDPWYIRLWKFFSKPKNIKTAGAVASIVATHI